MSVNSVSCETKMHGDWLVYSHVIRTDNGKVYEVKIKRIVDGEVVRSTPDQAVIDNVLEAVNALIINKIKDSTPLSLSYDGKELSPPSSDMAEGIKKIHDLFFSQSAVPTAINVPPSQQTIGIEDQYRDTYERFIQKKEDHERFRNKAGTVEQGCMWYAVNWVNLQNLSKRYNELQAS